MHEWAEKVWRAGALLRSDAARTLEVNIAVWVSLSGMKHPISRGRVVLQPELRAMLLGRWRSLADHAQANGLLGSGAWFVGLFQLAGHAVTDVRRRGLILTTNVHLAKAPVGGSVMPGRRAPAGARWQARVGHCDPIVTALLYIFHSENC